MLPDNTRINNNKHHYISNYDHELKIVMFVAAQHYSTHAGSGTTTNMTTLSLHDQRWGGLSLQDGVMQHRSFLRAIILSSLSVSLNKVRSYDYYVQARVSPLQ